jgi:hypothetical protein
MLRLQELLQNLEQMQEHLMSFTIFRTILIEEAYTLLPPLFYLSIKLFCQVFSSFSNSFHPLFFMLPHQAE